MQRKNQWCTITDLTTIFHVSRTSITSRINSDKLTKPLIKNRHIIKVGSKNNKHRKRWLFDDTALLDFALSFKGKISNRKSKVSKNGDSKSFHKDVLKDISNLNQKMDLIINKLHITY